MPKDTGFGGTMLVWAAVSPDTGPSKSLDLSGPGFLIYLKGHSITAWGLVPCDVNNRLSRRLDSHIEPVSGGSEHLRGVLIQQILTLTVQGRLERVSNSSGSTLWRRVLQAPKVASSASLPTSPLTRPHPSPPLPTPNPSQPPLTWQSRSRLAQVTGGPEGSV